jgi:hypothetical protein
MAMAKISLQMVMYILASINMAQQKDKVNTTGKMVTHLQDFSKMGKSQVMEYGRKRMEEQKPQIFIKESTKMTKSMATVSSLGQLEATTKETT